MSTLEAIDDVCAAWQEKPVQFTRAVDDTVLLHGYAQPDVERQLSRVAELGRLATMRATLARELPEGATPPAEIVHLAASTVPGLLVESLLHGLALGSRNQSRPSRGDTVTRHFVELLRERQRALGELIAIVEKVDWATPEAAIVYGSDDTVDLVRSKLRPDSRIAAFGTREGIAVTDRGDSGDWVTALADDVACFAQRGCMSPSTLFVVGDVDATALRDQLRLALKEALPRHVTGGGSDLFGARRATDDAALAWISGELVAAAGPLRVHVVPVADLKALRAQLEQMGTRLQTAVLEWSGSDRDAVQQLLLDVGCTRVVEAGSAQLPALDWTHDGIGRIAGLFRS